MPAEADNPAAAAQHYGQTLTQATAGAPLDAALIGIGETVTLPAVPSTQAGGT